MWIWTNFDASGKESPAARPLGTAWALVVTSTLGFGQALAQEPPCSVGHTKAELAAGAALSDSALNSLTRIGYAISGARCSSLASVLGRAAGTRRALGRKLEEGRPLDVAAAQAEYRSAQADSQFTGELQRDLAAETDPLRRRLIEATVLHDHGYVLARDLLLQALRSGVSQ